MKVRCIQDCNGLGYENFKKGQEREIQEHLANVLIEFKYAELVDPKYITTPATGGTINCTDVFGEASTETLNPNVKIGEGTTEKMIGTECNLGETNVLIVETEEEKKARLILRAEELEIKGVLSNFKIETLEKKIAEAEANL